MGALEEALERLKTLFEEHPEVASAGLLALAVERDLISAREARNLAVRPGLADGEAIRATLAVKLEEADRTDELVALLLELRRIKRRAEDLLAC